MATAVTQPAKVLSEGELAKILKDHADYLKDPKTGALADFRGVSLGNADFSGADLTQSRGLQARQLRGADLTGAKLPDAIAKSLETLPGVDEATKTSRKVFLTALVACLYCWLTILSTTDAALLIGNSTLALPIVQTQIPIAAFYGATPALLLIVYLYLHFSLQNLWDALATLPAVFPDGRPLHERALPWILSPIVRLYFDRLRDQCPRMAKFQVRAMWLLAWWAVPVTLAAFWARFLVRHDWVITALQVVLFGITVWRAVALWRITRDTLEGKAPAVGPLSETLRRREILAGVLTGGFLILFSVGCFYGAPSNDFDVRWNLRTTVPNLLHVLGWSAFGDLSYANLSAKPDGWNGKDLDAIKGAQLSGRSLRNVTGYRAFGVRADFDNADLRGANFMRADLRLAHFYGADLTGASFLGADLRGAAFNEARVNNFIFLGADVDGADFIATLGLEPRRIREAHNWMLATAEEDTLAALGLCAEPCDYEQRRLRKDFSGMDLSQGDFDRPDLSGANLRHSRMSSGDLSDSNLSKADLRDVNWGSVRLNGANLTGTDLRGTDLSHVLGLTLTQIQSAITDEKTKLPPYLEAQKPFPPRK